MGEVLQNGRTQTSICPTKSAELSMNFSSRYSQKNIHYTLSRSLAWYVINVSVSIGRPTDFAGKQHNNVRNVLLRNKTDPRDSYATLVTLLFAPLKSRIICVFVRCPLIAKFHYTGPTGPDQTKSADFVGDLGLVGSGPVGSGRADVQT